VTYKIIIHQNAAKKFTHSNKNLKRRLRRAIDNISQNPYFNVHVRKLKGKLSNMHRYRIGDIRIIYEIHEEIKAVRIKSIEERGDIY